MAQKNLQNIAVLDTSYEKRIPNQLTSAEYQELRQESGIHSDLIELNFFHLEGNDAWKRCIRLIELNFFHLEGNDALDRLFISDKLKRINTGAVSVSILKRYRHIEAGGWWVSGIDVLNNYYDDLWGQFKPTNPRLSADKGKIIKYEGPPKHPTGIIALKVSQLLWHKVAELNNIPLVLSFLDHDEQQEISFWSWVVNNPEVPLIITEGAKKAAALISAGYAAIALPGIFNGYRQPKDEFGRKTGLAKLIPQLQVFATPGRKVYFAFDRDTKASTISNVNCAIAKTGKLFGLAGVDVKVIRWQEEGLCGELNSPPCTPRSAKGVDDLIVRHGVEAFHQAYDRALPLETWLIRSSVQLTYKANIRVNRRYLGSLAKTEVRLEDEEPGRLGVLKDTPSDNWETEKTSPSPQVPESPSPLHIPDTAKLIGLKSPKGTGKTHLLEQIVDRATKEGKWVLLLTHRIQLGEALCQRVGLPYLTSWEKHCVKE